MDIKQKTKNIVQIMQVIYRKRVLSFYQHGLTQIRKLVAVQRIKNIPKINDSIFDEAQLSTRKNSWGTQYDSIKPLDHNYSSILMVQNKGFDLGAENETQKAINSLESELVYEKKQFIQKYLNQTKKPVLMIEQFPYSIFSTKTIEQYNDKALKNINSTEYEMFFEQVLAKKTFFGKQINRMQYKPTLIRSPLTIMQQKYDDIAIKMFGMILKFDEPNAHKNKFSYAADIVNNSMKLGEQLIVQLFMQIIKQTNGKRMKQYLQLLSVVSAVIRVPFRMYTALLNYFMCMYQKSPSDYSYIFYLMIRNFDSPRKTGITDFEAQCIIYKKQIPVIIDMPTELSFFMQTTASVEDLILKIISFFELDKNIKYLIYYNQNYYHTGKLFDCLYQSSYQIDDDTIVKNQQVYAKFNGFKITLTFKNMMDSLTSKVNRDILYLFQTRKYLQGSFSLKRDEMLMLAAYKYYAQNDVLDITDLCLYIPPMLLNHIGQGIAKRELVKKFKLIKCSKSQARKKFLKMLSDKDVFMGLIFFGKLYFDDDDQMHIDTIIFIKPGYITLLGYKQYPLYKTYQIQSIIQWGKTQSEICFRVSQIGFIHIQSNNQELLASIFEGYLKSLEQFVINDSTDKKIKKQDFKQTQLSIQKEKEQI